MRAVPPSFPSATSGEERHTHSTGIRMTNLYKATMNRMFTRKKAKQVKAEPKVELDLSIALPASDNFRTSLLMPNLTARFSMLREQDDPNTKIGKAVDDSVLQPRRQSRLYDMGFSPYGLDDIAEVTSIRSSIRPPFAAADRANSYASDGGYNTDDDSSHNGSVMSRARPGEGNVLFGGRQKIYKIAGDGLKGRTLYDDDVSTTSFQKYRQSEREREERDREDKERLQQLKDIRNGRENASPSKIPSASPSINGSLKRQTSSSTATSNLDSRASTAATSINSQGTPMPTPASTTMSTFNFGVPSQPIATTPAPALERSATKRRLYEQGLDRDIQEQQSTNMTRLNSIAKGRGGLSGRTTPDMFHARSGLDSKYSQERPYRPTPNSFRSQSPTPSPPGTAPHNDSIMGTGGINGFGSKEANSAPDHNSPLESPIEESNVVLASALNPNDRGKATAMGVFNKPKQFNEQQFLERQRTLRKGRETPIPRGGEMLADSPKESEEIDRDQLEEKMKSFTPGPTTEVNRSRSASSGYANRTRSPSTTPKFEALASPVVPTEPFANAGVSAFQRAAMQMKAISADAPPKESLPPPQKNRFAFQDDSESDYEQDQPVPSPQPPQPVRRPTNRLPTNPRLPDGFGALPAPPQHEHPAFRAPKLPEIGLPNNEPAMTNGSKYHHEESKSNGDFDVESPTLGPSGDGLSGLIRQHLRENSATSDYSTAQAQQPESYPPALQTRNLNNAGDVNSSADTPAHSSYSHSNPWDLEEFDEYVDNHSPVSPIDSANNTPRKDGGRPSHENTNGAIDYRRQVLAKASETAREAPWQEELRKKNHTRGGSSETQHERDAFDSEIAARRRAIQEKIKKKEEDESRSSSPGPTRPPFMGKLRTKSSRESSQVRGGDGKSMKLLGLNGSSTNLSGHSPSPPATAINERPSYDRWRTESSGPPRSDPRNEPRSRSRADTSHSREPVQQFPLYSNTMSSNTMSSQSTTRPPTGRESDERMRSRANSNVNSTRSRSNSEHSNGRSRSRSGRYRDDLAEAMAVGNSSRTTMYPEATPAIPEQYQAEFPAQAPIPEHPIPEVPLTMKEANALRIHQNKLDPATFEQKGLWPPPNPLANGIALPSPRPSPGFAPGGAALSPALSGISPRPSPGIGPMSPGLMPNGRASPMAFPSNPTPPISASSTPIAPSFPTNNSTVLSSGTFGRKANRKMSIKKTEISEPKLISTTSVIDTVDLPVGASLMNGMEDAPPLPPINPRRKRFGFGRSEFDPPEPAFVSTQYNSLSADERERQPRSRHRLRKSSSDGAKIGLHIRAQQQGLAMQSTPTLPHEMSSPPRRGAVEGGMF